MSIGQGAEETKEWDRFWNSGRVEDYLRYRSSHTEQEQGREALERTENPCGIFCR